MKRCDKALRTSLHARINTVKLIAIRKKRFRIDVTDVCYMYSVMRSYTLLRTWGNREQKDDH